MQLRRIAVVLCAISSIAVVACSTNGQQGDAGTSVNSIHPTSPSVQDETSISVPENSEAATDNQQVGVEVVVPHISDAQTGWSTEFTLGYGDDKNQISQELYGQGGAWIAADACASDTEGNWWVMEAGKRRFAQFDRVGNYLGEITIPVVGSAPNNFHYTDLTISDSGVLSTIRYGDSSSFVLLADTDGISEVEVDGAPLMLGYFDDRLILVDEGGRLLAVDTTARRVLDDDQQVLLELVGFERLVAGNALDVDLHPEGVDSRIVVTSEDGPLLWSNEMLPRFDGSVWIIIRGTRRDETGGNYGAVFVLDRDGTVSDAVPLPVAMVLGDNYSTSSFFVDELTSRLAQCVASESGLLVMTLER